MLYNFLGRCRNVNEMQTEEMELQLFTLTKITNATKNFSISCKLREGGFGRVDKGILVEGQEIAEKQLSKTSIQGLEDFKNEVVCIAKLKHRNLVKLLGYCLEDDGMLLINEFMPNNSLDSIIFDEKRRQLLDWRKRYHLIYGIACRLLYLHQDSRLRIIHRDLVVGVLISSQEVSGSNLTSCHVIPLLGRVHLSKNLVPLPSKLNRENLTVDLKASNVLLDSNLNPKISDFGLATRFGGNEMGSNTRMVVGTYGYMSPEYAVHGFFSVKSDVFSFGFLLLEIVSGKKDRGFFEQDHGDNLLGHAWRLFKEYRSMELIDAALLESLRSVQVGLLWVQHSLGDRMSMSSVVLMLAGEVALPEHKQPG